MESFKLQCKEFLNCAFSPVNEHAHLITLSGEGDWCVILWQWEQMKMLAKVDFMVIEPLDSRIFQTSYYQVMAD